MTRSGDWVTRLFSCLLPVLADLDGVLEWSYCGVQTSKAKKGDSPAEIG